MRLAWADVPWWNGYQTLIVEEPPKQPDLTGLTLLQGWIGEVKPLHYVPVPFREFLGIPPLRHYPHERWQMCINGQDLSGKTFLDVGCNVGYYAFLAAAAGARCVGIETDPKASRVMREISELYGLADRIKVINAPFVASHLTEFRPDVVFAFSVLPYIGQQDQAKLRGLLSVMAEAVPVSYIEMGDGGSEMDWCKGDAQFWQLFRESGFRSVDNLGNIESSHTGTRRTLWRCQGGG